MSLTQELKKKLRQQIQKRLYNLDIDRDRTATAVYDNLCKLPQFRKAKLIATYVDFKKEVPTTPFLPRLFENKNGGANTTNVAVPFCEGSAMQFYRLSSPKIDSNGSPVFEELKPGKFGILEPLKELRNDVGKIVNPHDIDVVLIPGVAFDAQGRRLGRGVGYYDRYLATLLPSAALVGLAFDCQIVDQVPVEEHDVRVSVVVTPTQLLFVQKQDDSQYLN